MVNVGFDLFSQHDTGRRIYVMDLVTGRTSYRFIDAAVLRRILGGKTLNPVSRLGATVDEERHAI